MTRLRIGLTALSILFLFSPSFAVSPATPGDVALKDEYQPSHRLYDGIQTPGTQRLLSRRLPFARAAEKETGVQWWILWNEMTRRPRLALVGGAPIAEGVVESERELYQLGRGVIDRFGGEFGAVNEELQEFRVRSQGKRRLVQFRQRADGFLATPTFFNVVFFQRDQELVLSRVGGELFLDLGSGWSPSLELETAEALARSVVAEERIEVVSGGDLEIVPVRDESGKFFVPTLSYRFRVEAKNPIAHYEIRIDAETGKTIAAFDTINYVDFEGNVSGWGSPGLLSDSASNPETLAPLEGVRVNAPGIGTAFTDANGDFTLPYSGTAPANLTFELRTSWVNVDNATGADSVITQSVTPGSPANIVFNPSQVGTVTSQVNACRHTHRVHDYIKTIDSSFTSLDFPMECNVNISDSCNAFYTAGTINFFLPGGGCANTAFSTVVYHEYGHAVVDAAFPFFPQGNYNEGISDVCSALLVDDPTVGAGFNGGPGTFIRDIDIQDRTYPNDVGGPIHNAGLIVGGSFWDTLEAMSADIGRPAALAVCRDLYLLHMDFLSGQIAPILTIDVLTVDDDDGNLLNGTPNYASINTGFSAHGLPAPELNYIGFSHTPLTDTEIDFGNYPVQVEVEALINPSITSVDLFYSTGAGFAPIPLTAGSGNTYQGLLPAAPSPAQLEYYFRAIDSNGNVSLYPETAPSSPFAFLIGVVDTVFSQPVGPSDQGFTHVEVSGQDDWQRGVPNEQDDNVWDPLVAFSPPFVWGNDLNPAGWNGDYRNDVENYLETPSIDCSGKFGVQLKFRRWLTVEKSQYDQARITVNGTQIWVNPFGTDVVDTQWVGQSIDISSIADDNPNVRVRFELETDGGLVFGGWNLDDIELISVTESNPSIFNLTAEDAVGPAGGIVETSVALQNDEAIRDYTVAVEFDSTQLICTEVTLDGTDAGALDPDFFFADIRNDSGIYSANVTIDLIQLDVLPVSTNQSILKARFEIPASVPQTTVLTLAPGVDLGIPPVGSRLITEDFETIVPGLVSGTITVLGTADAAFTRGDANRDTLIDLSDAVSILFYTSIPGTDPLTCFDAADVDDNGVIEITDAIFLIQYLVVSGVTPPPPFDSEGSDPTPDALGCDD